MSMRLANLRGEQLTNRRFKLWLYNSAGPRAHGWFMLSQGGDPLAAEHHAQPEHAAGRELAQSAELFNQVR